MKTLLLLHLAIICNFLYAFSLVVIAIYWESFKYHQHKTEPKWKKQHFCNFANEVSTKKTAANLKIPATLLFFPFRVAKFISLFWHADKSVKKKKSIIRKALS